MGIENINSNNSDIEKKVEFQEQDPEIMKYVYDCATRRLEQFYGVDNLTTIEAVRLREIIKEVLRDEREYVQNVEEDAGENPLFGQNMFSVDEEAVARWIHDLYGYRAEDIPSSYVIDGYINCKNGNEADKKLEEMRQKGQTAITLKAFPTEEFKIYFKKVREEAHKQWG